MLGGEYAIKEESEQDKNILPPQLIQHPVDVVPDSDTDSQLSQPPISQGQDKYREGSSSESEDSSNDDYDDYEAVENFQVGRFLFCQRCSNLLTIDTDEGLKCYRLVCPTCPFYLNVTRRFVLSKEKSKVEEEQKEVIYDAAKANEHRQKTEVLCPECTHNEAYFYQMQTRSADEPMTNFYQCLKCKHNWRD